MQSLQQALGQAMLVCLLWYLQSASQVYPVYQVGPGVLQTAFIT